MRSTHIQIITLASLLLISACSGNAAQQTAVADNAMLSTQIIDLRTTATFEADQLKQTQEYVETLIPKANRLRDELASTLLAVGIDVTLQPVEPNTSFTVSPRATAPSASTEKPAIIVEGVNLPTSTPSAPDISSGPNVPEATATVGTPTLFNLVTAAGVGSNDCALGSVTSFTPDTKEIYVVATAANVPAGTKIGAQWYLGDTPLVSQDFAPKNDVNNDCIWFYAEPVDFPFTEGSYHVDLLVNDTPLSGATANFTIQGTDQTQTSGG